MIAGNGARCFARFIQRVTGSPPIASEGRVSFLTAAGVVCATLHAHTTPLGNAVPACDTRQVTLDMPLPRHFRMNLVIPMSNQPPRLAASRDESGLLSVPIHFVDTGVPHAVCFREPETESASEQPDWFLQFSRELRWHEMFQPRGTNVNVVSLIPPCAGESQSTLQVRTYERGVEAETLACGTGATAAALIAAQIHHLCPPVRVVVQSGDALEVSWSAAEQSVACAGSAMTNVTLCGPATFVFDGIVTHVNVPAPESA